MLKSTLLICVWYISLICRDIKPDNILLDKDGHCRVADFGLATLGVSHRRKRNSFCGTLHYMAPEVIITFYFECDIMGGSSVVGWMDFRCDSFKFF
jgi:serine/threonine protein kinase